MENRASHEDDQELDDDVLSLCNLTMQESSNQSSPLQTPRSASSFSSSPESFFEFSSSDPDNNDDDEERYFSAPEIIFCGKVIQKEEQQRRPDPVKPQEEPASPRAAAASSSSYQKRDRKVNMTALTSMSAKSRRRMFMFGPVKFKPEMDLSAIKERQGKRLTTLLSPEMMWDGGNAVVRDVGAAAAAVEGGKRRQWGIVKATLKGRAHLSNVLARSFMFGCIPAASGAGRNCVQVAN